MFAMFFCLISLRAILQVNMIFPNFIKTILIYNLPIFSVCLYCRVGRNVPDKEVDDRK
jgi:hypothetical protein